MDIVWTDYIRYRANLRGFDLAKIEHVVRHSTERYYDTVTYRFVAVGRHDHKLILVPYEQEGDCIVPITVHVTTRQQISFRLRTGRYRHE